MVVSVYVNVHFFDSICVCHLLTIMLDKNLFHETQIFMFLSPFGMGFYMFGGRVKSCLTLLDSRCAFFSGEELLR